MAKKVRTAIGTPITPGLLKELKILENFPELPENYNPWEYWKHTYRIWGCHGYRASGNYDVGYVSILKRSARTSVMTMLQVEQKNVLEEGQSSRLFGDLRCNNDEHVSLLQWRGKSDIYNSKGELESDLSAIKDGRMNGNKMSLRSGAGSTEREVKLPLVSNFALFDTVQMMALNEKTSLEFTLLEDNDVLKENQKITYKGVEALEVGGKSYNLRHYTQTGSGILPYDYYVDESNRLLLVISMNKVYILDDGAEAAFDKYLQEQKEVYLGYLKRAEGAGSKGLDKEGGAE